MKKIWLAIVALVVVVCPVAASAQERSATKPGFTFPTDRPVSVVVFRPDTTVGTLTTGGVSEPNADWTATARGTIQAALRKSDTIAGAKLIFQDADPEGDDGAYLAEYRSLFKAVASAIQTNRLFVGARLPTKKEKFDWTLGEGTGRIGKMVGADYGLFIYTFDSYGSAGRKAVQALGFLGCMVGVCILPNAGVDIGYAGLVDLHTGEVLWLNADPSMGGDVRTPEGADKRVGQLFGGFPGTVDTAKTDKRK